MDLSNFLNLKQGALYKYKKVDRLSYQYELAERSIKLLREETGGLSDKKLLELNSNIVETGDHSYLLGAWQVTTGDCLIKFKNNICLPAKEDSILVAYYTALPDEGFFQVGHKEIYIYNGSKGISIPQYLAMHIISEYVDISQDYILTYQGWLDYINAKDEHIPFKEHFGSEKVLTDTSSLRLFPYRDFYYKSLKLHNEGKSEHIGNFNELEYIKIYKLPYMSNEQAGDFSIAMYSMQTGNNMSYFCCKDAADFIDSELEGMQDSDTNY